MKAGIVTGIALGLAAAGGIIAFAIMKNAPVADPVAEIRVSGEVVRRVPLSQDCEFTVECGNGSNTIRISDGKVAVTEADCPDKVCVNTGAISGGMVPIICLPHQLEVVVVSGTEEADAVAY